MQHKLLGIVVFSAVVFTGCSDIVALNSSVTDSQAATDGKLAGVWTDGHDICIIREPIEGVYPILYAEAPDPAASGSGAEQQFEGRLLRTNDAEILDVVPAATDEFHLAAHMWARVRPGDKELRWAWLDSDWLRQMARAKLATQEPRDRMVVTSPVDAVRAFLTAYGGNDRAQSDSTIWKRLN